jgi:hypothetical protein
MWSTLLWNVTLCDLVEVYRRYGGPCYLHFSRSENKAHNQELIKWHNCLLCLLFDLEYGGSTYLRNDAEFVPNFTIWHSTRQYSSIFHGVKCNNNYIVYFGLLTGSLFENWLAGARCCWLVGCFVHHWISYLTRSSGQSSLPPTGDHSVATEDRVLRKFFFHSFLLAIRITQIL